MAVVEIRKPFEVFNDTDGKPLDSGFVYIGVSGSEPQSTPKAVFWDSGLTIPAVQPLRTNNGYIVNNGTPAAFYTDGGYSMKVVDYSGVTIALRLVNSDGAVTLGSLATQNEGAGGADFRDNAANDARFLLRSEYTAAPGSGSGLRIINGDFSVNQAGASSGGLVVGGAYPQVGAYSGGGMVDRFFYGGGPSSTSDWTYVSNSSDIGGGFVPARTLRLQSGNQLVAGDWSAIVTRLESARTYNGRTVTLFGWMKRATSGDIAVSIRQHFGTGGSPSADVTTYIGRISLTALWSPYKIVAQVPSVLGKTFGTNNNDYLEIVYWISAGSTYNATTGSLGLFNTTVDFYGIHDRPGDQPIDVINAYQPPDPQTELAKCQRYFTRLDYCARVSNANPFIGQFVYPTTMRAVPSATFTYGSGTGATWDITANAASQSAAHSTNTRVTQVDLSAEL